MLTASKLLRPLVIVLLGLVMVGSADAQDRRANYILPLNSDNITSFRSAQRLRSTLPENIRDRIDSIELRFAGTEAQPPQTMNLNVEVNGTEAEIAVDEAVLTTLQRQPIRIPLNGKKFETVFLRYAGQNASGNQTQNESENDVVMGDGPNQFVLELSDDSEIAGSLNMTEIKMVTAFGPVKITLDQVAGIKFYSDGNDEAVVFLTNGDAITGIPELGVLNVETFWGLAEVNARNVRTMSTSTSSQFTQQNTDFGPRWQLKMGNGRAPGPGPGGATSGFSGR